MKTNLICISGPDGSGKSTQINLLIENFKNKGINYEYRWLRFNHFFSLPLLLLARLLGLSKVEFTKNGEKIGYHYFYKSKIISRFYMILMYFDTLFFTIIKVTIPMKFLNSNIACDRFIYDTLIDLMISTGDYTIYNSWIGKSFLRLIPKNSYFLMLITDESTLKYRREDVMYDINIDLKIKLYKKMANEYGINVINARLNVNEVNSQILRSLNEQIV